MRVWLLQDPGASRPDLFRALNNLGDSQGLDCQVEQRPFGPALAEEVHSDGPDVLVLYRTNVPPDPLLTGLLEAGPALVAIVSPERAGDYRALGERYPVHLVPAPPSPEGLWLALHAAGAARRQRLAWQQQVEELRQRLDDRIVIERAKGLLAHDARLSEEQAYKRLRVLSRQQRRPVREIARALLDAQALLRSTEGGAEEQVGGGGRTDKPDKGGKGGKFLLDTKEGCKLTLTPHSGG